MAAGTDKQQKDNGLKDYGIIYISRPIDGGTAEPVCKEIIDLNIKGEVNQIDGFERKVVMLLLMQYAVPDFIAMYKESGLEHYSDNGMDTRDIKRSQVPQEFNLHIELEHPPEERQIRQWEEVLGKGSVDDDQLVKLVETHPMHITEIGVIARQAEILATIKGNVTGKPCLADIREVISGYRQV